MSFENPEFQKFTPKVDKLTDKINETMYESGFPNEDYKSTLGVYGGKMKTEEGKMVWDNSGLVSKIDKWGDAIFRTFDDHLVKDMGAFFRRDPRLFFKFLAPGAKKYRGSKEEIFENVQRLGLENTYGLHEKGIEIKDQDLFRHGVPLQDVYRSDLIDSEKVKDLDRFQALAETGKYIRQIHDAHGAIGELVSGDIIFKKQEGGRVSEPILNLPDIVFNKDKAATVSEKNNKATDILELLVNIGAEEFRRSEDDMGSVREALKTLLASYDDKSVINLVKSYIKRGRLVLAGDKQSKVVDLPEDTFTAKHRGTFAIHNKVRQIVNTAELEAALKEISVELCEELGSKGNEE
ncbi:MAG: hypothetical protein WC545_00925 [Patescibacteria group bacterium]